ncbi:cysteine desulfurase [Candidatus Marinarcus aquaticus]|uniref:Cysteine desulfurase n=1 Tax=Candidatus Marinarcus aquaticus TaxID=2044504 RepID=A0A4Q0XTF0_9BACT|nr:cysteine desulfurase [Candidatus Marinarcus aquaticus]RXJ60790.1 cysteine desulfurase [Candidatus Marinarcus aquaticus]
MIKLNHLQYSRSAHLKIDNTYSMSALVENTTFEELCIKYKEHFGYLKLKTFAFSKEGFLGLLLELKGTVAIGMGETLHLIQAGKLYESLGFEVIWLPLQKDGKVNLSLLDKESIDFLFLSSYVADTFMQTSIKEVKEKTSAMVISNGTAHIDQASDALYLDPYKLFGFNTSGVLLFNNESFELLSVGAIDTLSAKLLFDTKTTQVLNSTLKPQFIEALQIFFKEDIYFFVDSKETLPYTLHFGLKGIKAREFIRTLALNEIYISNGEGCSLGLSKPSRIIQAMGYDETSSRNAIVLSFRDEMSDEEVQKLTKLMYLKYKQIKSFS